MPETYRDKFLSVIPNGNFTARDIRRLLRSKKLFVPSGPGGTTKIASQLRKEGVIRLVRVENGKNVWRKT